MEIIENGGVTSAKGFKAAGIKIGLKASGNKDLALIFSENPAVSAAAFTKNLVKAAPILLDQELIQNPLTQAVIINSGNANACTGELGLQNARVMSEQTSKLLNVAPEAVLVASTGVIGVQLDMDKVNKGIERIIPELSENGGAIAAQAIMTTDLIPKEIAVTITIDGKTVTMGGMAKGSGMIHPNMGTMLAFITTDLAIEKSLLQKLFSDSIEDSYNMVSVDGDTSTNDCAIIMANGAAGNTKITDENSEGYEAFKAALNTINQTLAKLIAQDGEGATKLIEVTTQRAKTKQDARKVAKSVIGSSLVKTAIFGGDANWGRILCAVGYSGADLIVDNIKIFVSGKNDTIQIVDKGAGVVFEETKLDAIFKEKKIMITIDLNDGAENATAWGCDLSYDYIKINADYRT